MNTTPLYRIIGRNDRVLKIVSNPKEVARFSGATAIERIVVTDKGIKILSHRSLK